MTQATDTLILTDPVGINEIADRLDVEPATVRSWRSRGPGMTRQPPLPKPDATLTNSPIWNWETIREWAEETSRL